MASASFGPDFSAIGASGGGGNKRRKDSTGRAVGGDADPRMAALAANFSTLARLTLANAGDIRTLKAIIMRSIALPNTHRFAVLMLAAQQQYATATKGQKGHGKGIPEFWAWRAFAQAALEAAPDDDVKSKMEAHIATLTDAAAYKGMVGHCICKKAYGDGRSRIEVSVAPAWQTVLDLVISILVSDPLTEVHDGRAPRGNSERVLSDALSQFERKE